MECMEGKHASFAPFVFIFLSSFSFAFPTLILSILVKNRKKLYLPAFKRRLGFLYAPFNFGAEYWELHEVFRKMILTGMLIFIEDMKVRAVVASIVSVLAVGSLNYFKPHRNLAVFYLAELAFMCSSIKYLCVILVIGSQARKKDESLGITMLCIDVLFMLSSFFFMGMSIHLLRKAITATKKKLAQNERERRQKMIEREEHATLGQAWLRYAVRPGIKEPALSRYAEVFNKNSVSVNMLMHEDKEVVYDKLSQMSITKPSHQKRIYSALVASDEKLKKLNQCTEKSKSLDFGALQQAMVNLKVHSIHEEAAKQKKMIQGQIQNRKADAKKRLMDRLNRRQGRRKQQFVLNK